MKNLAKLFMIVILVIVVILSICPKAYAKEIPTLDNIINLFNVCKAVKKCNQEGTKNIVASKYVDSIDSNNVTTYLRVRVTDEWSVKNLDYLFSGNVLTGEYVGGDTRIREYWIEITEILIDCIEQFHGYAEGEFFDTLHTTQVANYTLANEGLVIETNSPSRYYTQIDITKTIPTLDVNTYVKENDLTDLANNISGDGIAKYKKGNIVFYKYTVNDKDILTIGELTDFTYKIDKSILTVLKVMFGKSEPVEYFKTNYPSVDTDKNFAGFTIEVNPIKNETEQHVFAEDQDYKFVRITIDRTAVADALNKKSNPENPVVNPPVNPPVTTPVVPEEPSTGGTPGSSTGTTGSDNSAKLPKTGRKLNGTVLTLWGIFSIAFIGVILISLNKKEVKNKNS